MRTQLAAGAGTLLQEQGPGLGEVSESEIASGSGKTWIASEKSV
jgi:hypothetical protein